MRHSGENMLVFTCYSVETLLRFGGSQSWRCNPKRAAAAQYLICTRNCHHKMADELSGHGDGFLIARISQIIPAFYFPGRWLIGFDAYAEIYCPACGQGRRTRWPISPPQHVKSMLTGCISIPRRNGILTIFRPL